MAVERIIRPAAYYAGKTADAVLTVRFRDVNGKRRSVKVGRVGSYRLREDGGRFSVRHADRAGSRNTFVIEYGAGDTATIRTNGGNALRVSDVTLTLAEGTYTVVTA